MYCITVIRNLHVSQQLVHWLFWVTIGFSLVLVANTLKQTVALLPHHSVILVFIKTKLFGFCENQETVFNSYGR
jgi:hypothetical protein